MNRMFAGLAILPMAVWTVLTALNDDSNCWVVDDDYMYMYILDGPRILTLVVSTY
jgi:hypothetical protein